MHVTCQCPAGTNPIPVDQVHAAELAPGVPLLIAFQPPLSLLLPGAQPLKTLLLLETLL